MYEKIRAAINASDGFARQLGIVVEEVSHGYSKATMPLDDNHRNTFGNVHGAASFALADMAFAGVVLSSNIATVNISSSVSFTNAGTVGPITAIGKLISESRRLCTVEVNVTDATGKLIAVMTGTGYRMNKPFVPNESDTQQG